MHVALANILGPYMDNWLLIAVVALLLFGRRLPEMGAAWERESLNSRRVCKGLKRTSIRPAR